MIFFSNPKISSDKLINPHYQKTVERIKASRSRYILAIQDQMYLNFTKHRAKHDLGMISKTGKKTQYGIIQHSVLCVDDKNEPFGLLNVNHFDYSEFDSSKCRNKRDLSEKASMHWTQSLETMRKRLGDTEKRIITVADREGDFYEFLYPLIKTGEEFVIRSQHNRMLGDVYKAGCQKLNDVFATTVDKGEMLVRRQDVHTRQIKEITLHLQSSKIDIPVPKRLNQYVVSKKDYKSIALNVVRAYNQEQEWVLLTSLPVDTLEEIKEVVTIYRSRWHIENYHKILKTGYQVDEIYLHSSKEAIRNLLVMASVSACRLYWLIYVGRSQTEMKADHLFKQYEWEAIYVYFNEPIPKEVPIIKDVILQIARLGGYKNNKHAKPPGIKTMWIGYQAFDIIVQMYCNMSGKT